MTASNITPAVAIPKMPSTARPVRTCKTRGCKHTLAYNNTTGFCTDCQEQKGRAHFRKPAQPAAPNLLNPNGAGHSTKKNGNGNGNGAHATEDPIQSVGLGVESRVDLLLAAVPRADRAKMLSAWLAGTL